MPRKRSGEPAGSYSRRPDASIFTDVEPQRGPLVGRGIGFAVLRPALDFLRPVGRIANLRAGLRGIARGRAEQPGMDIIRDSPEPAVLDALAVVPAHRRVGVAHDEVDG